MTADTKAASVSAPSQVLRQHFEQTCLYESQCLFQPAIDLDHFLLSDAIAGDDFSVYRRAKVLMVLGARNTAGLDQKVELAIVSNAGLIAFSWLVLFPLVLVLLKLVSLSKARQSNARSKARSSYASGDEKESTVFRRASTCIEDSQKPTRMEHALLMDHLKSGFASTLSQRQREPQATVEEELIETGRFATAFVPLSCSGKSGVQHIEALHKLEGKRYSVVKVRLSPAAGQLIRSLPLVQRVAAAVELQHANLGRFTTYWAEEELSAQSGKQATWLYVQSECRSGRMLKASELNSKEKFVVFNKLLDAVEHLQRSGVECSDLSFKNVRVVGGEVKLTNYVDFSQFPQHKAIHSGNKKIAEILVELCSEKPGELGEEIGELAKVLRGKGSKRMGVVEVRKSREFLQWRDKVVREFVEQSH